MSNIVDEFFLAFQIHNIIYVNNLYCLLMIMNSTLVLLNFDNENSANLIVKELKNALLSDEYKLRISALVFQWEFTNDEKINNTIKELDCLKTPVYRDWPYTVQSIIGITEHQNPDYLASNSNKLSFENHDENWNLLIQWIRWTKEIKTFNEESVSTLISQTKIQKSEDE